jgi:lipoate-protein ligase A
MLFMLNEETDPALNLAAEEYLLRHCSEDCCMLWQNHNAIIVGRNQNTRAEINPKFVSRHGTSVIRRLSGGGAVFHDLGNVNFTFIKTRVKELAIDFRSYTQPILAHLREMGLVVGFDGRNDLVLNDYKISGNAQYLHRDRVLHHGTLLYDVNLEHLAESLRVDSSKFRDKAVQSIRSRVTNIREHLKDPIPVEDFMTGLMSCLKKRAGGRTTAFTRADRTAIQALAEERYCKWEWNFGSSPAYNFKKSIRANGGTLEAHLDVHRGIIRQARLCGDFFGIRDIAEMEQALVGCRHSAEAICRRLDGLAVEDYLKNIGGEELVEALS